MGWQYHVNIKYRVCTTFVGNRFKTSLVLIWTGIYLNIYVYIHIWITLRVALDWMEDALYIRYSQVFPDSN